MPGRRADLVLIDDLASFNVKYVWSDGRAVVQDGVAVKGAQAHSIPLPHAVQTTCPSPRSSSAFRRGRNDERHRDMAKESSPASWRMPPLVP